MIRVVDACVTCNQFTLSIGCAIQRLIVSYLPTSYRVNASRWKFGGFFFCSQLSCGQQTNFVPDFVCLMPPQHSTCQIQNVDRKNRFSSIWDPIRPLYTSREKKALLACDGKAVSGTFGSYGNLPPICLTAQIYGILWQKSICAGLPDKFGRNKPMFTV